LLACLCVNDLDNARYLWRRIPSANKQKDAQLVAVWSIGRAIWLRDYAAVYQQFQSCDWDNVHRQIVCALEGLFRSRTIHLISRAFQAISGANLATYLGLPVEEAFSFAASRGWTRTGDFVSPTPPDDSKVTLGTTANLQSLSEYVVYLETDLSVPYKPTEKPKTSAPKTQAGTGGKTSKQ